MDAGNFMVTFLSGYNKQSVGTLTPALCSKFLQEAFLDWFKNQQVETQLLGSSGVDLLGSSTKVFDLADRNGRTLSVEVEVNTPLLHRQKYIWSFTDLLRGFSDRAKGHAVLKGIHREFGVFQNYLRRDPKAVQALCKLFQEPLASTESYDVEVYQDIVSDLEEGILIPPEEVADPEVHCKVQTNRTQQEVSLVSSGVLVEIQTKVDVFVTGLDGRLKAVRAY